MKFYNNLIQKNTNRWQSSWLIRLQELPLEQLTSVTRSAMSWEVSWQGVNASGWNPWLRVLSEDTEMQRDVDRHCCGAFKLMDIFRDASQSDSTYGILWDV